MDGLKEANKWCDVYQGGNMWGQYDCYLTAARDILKLKLDAHEKFRCWEGASINGGFRVMHEKFCIVSDFPKFIKIDDQNRPHCENGPSHQWRDGWSLYHWHGTKVPQHWIEQKEKLTAAEIMKEANLENRRAGIEIIGWAKFLQGLSARVIDNDADPMVGCLVELDLPINDVTIKARFLKVRCGTGRDFAICVPPTIKSALDAQAWMQEINPKDFRIPEVRT